MIVFGEGMGTGLGCGFDDRPRHRRLAGQLDGEFSPGPMSREEGLSLPASMDPEKQQLLAYLEARHWRSVATGLKDQRISFGDSSDDLQTI